MFIENPVRIEYIPIISDSLFDYIWESGLLQAINEKCNSFIDHYEEELIEPDHYPEIRKIVEKMLRKNCEGILYEFLISFKELLIEAERIQMPMYFIL